MIYALVIAAHNEEEFISDCIESVLNQTVLPRDIIVVNDNSTDRTAELLEKIKINNPLLKVIHHQSSDDHMPGSKVVAAFNYGLQHIEMNSIDLIVKLDADLILPNNYFEDIINCFKADSRLGIAGGFAYEQDNKGVWKLNHSMNTDHIRGAFKTYRKECFQQMEGLRTAMGWDTADELLAQFHGYTIKTLDHLKVKHLRPLGKAYSKKAKLLQGKAMYGLRYGFKAKKEKAPFLVSETEGAFIRKLRWKGIKQKLIP